MPKSGFDIRRVFKFTCDDCADAFPAPCPAHAEARMEARRAKARPAAVAARRTAARELVKLRTSLAGRSSYTPPYEHVERDIKETLRNARD